MTSKRHWPDLFKVKPSNNSSPNEGTSSKEERRDLKPKLGRWNPLPEQIQILESIFHTGMVSPQVQEIEKITKRLQEYGQVGRANVFYWFQNRKSRNKRKRHLQAKSIASSETPSPSFDQYSFTNSNAGSVIKTIGESSSSSIPPFSSSFPMQCLSQKDHDQLEDINVDDYLNMEESPTLGGIQNEYLCPPISTLHQPYTTFLMNEEQTCPKLSLNHDLGALADNIQLHENCLKSTLTYSTVVHSRRESVVKNTNGVLASVLINGIPFDAPIGPMNVEALFGKNAVLTDSYGQPVLVDEQGFTLQGLQQGAMHYLVYV